MAGLCVVVAACGSEQDTPGTGGTGGTTSSGGSGGTVSSGGAGGATSSGTGNQDLKDISQSCVSPGQCVSGYCPADDGVCCDEACELPCQGCVESKTGKPNGCCAPLSAEADPQGGCIDPYFCDPSGFCCGLELPPPGTDCPDVCSGGCESGVCTIDCSGEKACENDDITCPEGLACKLVCAGEDACREATRNCPLTYACTVDCDASTASCRKATIQCSTGPCTLTCASDWDVCRDTELECGPNACTAICDPNNWQQPDVACHDSCDCEEC